jgi:phosphatidylserine decarboxylase
MVSLPDRLTLAVLRVLPQHVVSHLVGWAAARQLPVPLRQPAARAFGRLIGVDFSEVRDPLSSFASVQAFFTRALRDGARSVDEAPDALVSPCDGSWGCAGTVEDGQLLQVKGRAYSLARLLGDPLAAREFEGGTYATLYLAPRDYHRFHAPCTALVRRIVYLPGALWPVNRLGREKVGDLFAVNERLCVYMAAGVSAADLCLVAVGATLVGKIRLSFDGLATNAGGAVAERHYPEGIRLGKGQECGRFEFGSTIVLLAKARAATITAAAPDTPVRLGERIGTMHVGG